MKRKRHRHLGLVDSQKPERYQAHHPGRPLYGSPSPWVLRRMPRWLEITIVMIVCAIVGMAIGLNF